MHGNQDLVIVRMLCANEWMLCKHGPGHLGTVLKCHWECLAPRGQNKMACEGQGQNS